MNVTTTRDNLPAVLDLVDEMLRQPSFPAAELEVLRKEAISELESQRSQPEALAFTAMQRKVQPKAKDAVDYVPTVDEKIERVKAMKLDDVKKLHALLGASHAQLTVVGDFDAKVIGDKATALWAGWKSPKPWKRLEDRFIETPGSAEFIDTPDKENGLIAAAFALPMRDDDPDYPALQVVNYVLGGSGFTSRMVKRLREKEGLSYGAGSQFVAMPEDALAFLFGFAMLAPQNAVKGMVGLVEEFERVAREGITAEELAGAKSGLVKDFQRSLSSDGFVLSKLHTGLYLGRTLEFDAKLNASVESLTLEQVNAAAKKHVKPSLLIRVTGADKKKAEGGKK